MRIPNNLQKHIKNFTDVFVATLTVKFDDAFWDECENSRKWHHDI